MMSLLSVLMISKLTLGVGSSLVLIIVLMNSESPFASSKPTSLSSSSIPQISAPPFELANALTDFSQLLGLCRSSCTFLS